MMLREGVPRNRIVEVATDSILHEFGHIIAEWGRKRDAPLLALIEEDWPDEEDFAEEFAQFLSGRSYTYAEAIDAIIARYVATSI
jgi:hypothetical protein